jgi:hypothetical protein
MSAKSRQRVFAGSALDRGDQFLGVDHAQRVAAEPDVAVEQAWEGDDLRGWPDRVAGAHVDVHG